MVFIVFLKNYNLLYLNYCFPLRGPLKLLFQVQQKLELLLQIRSLSSTYHRISEYHSKYIRERPRNFKM